MGMVKTYVVHGQNRVLWQLGQGGVPVSVPRPKGAREIGVPPSKCSGCTKFLAHKHVTKPIGLMGGRREALVLRVDHICRQPYGPPGSLMVSLRTWVLKLLGK